MRFIRKTNYYQDIQVFKHEGQIFWYTCLALTLFSLPFFSSDFYLGELALVFIITTILGISMILIRIMMMTLAMGVKRPLKGCLMTL